MDERRRLERERGVMQSLMQGKMEWKLREAGRGDKVEAF